MKRIIAILLVLFTLITALATASSAYYINDLIFTDVKENDWFYISVYNCWIWGYICGMTNEKGENIFKPNDTLTRAQFLQMLANSTMDLIYNTSYASTDTGFEDVKTTHWYNAAIAWGVEKGIVKGVSETRFAPNDPITREQMARMLYLFVEYKGYNMNYTDDLSAFTDTNDISDWALPQMQWAVASNIIAGYGNGELRPRRNTTRAEACVMLNAVETYFKYDGPEMQDGVFAAICDYVVENGEDSSVDRDMEWSIENDGFKLTVRCTKSKDYININYTKENGDGVKENIYFDIYALTDYYDYTYDQRIAGDNGKYEFPCIIQADLTLDGFANVYGSTGDTREAQWQSLHEEFITAFTEFIESLGYTYEDLFR